MPEFNEAVVIRDPQDPQGIAQILLDGGGSIKLSASDGQEFGVAGGVTFCSQEMFVRGSPGRIRVIGRRDDGADRDAVKLERRGAIIVTDPAGRTVLQFEGQGAGLDIGAREGGNSANLNLRDGGGDLVFLVNAFTAGLEIGKAGNAGHIFVRDGDGNVAIHLDGSSGVVTQGGDCAEDFPGVPSDDIDRGTVVVLGDNEKLRISSEPYDRRVAGVISGARGESPGLVLGRRPTEDFRVPLALSGRVWCKVDGDYGPIAAGDLLTTSSTPGHAMRATDPLRAFGAVIGKALRPTGRGTTLLPVLIALQ
jgi:hypothetical protein